jgi:hypothetical protein
MGKPDGAKGSGPPAGLGDARFAKMYTDPRFQRFPKKKGKVEIDSRFASETPVDARVQPDLAAAAAALVTAAAAVTLMVGCCSTPDGFQLYLKLMRAYMSAANCVCTANMPYSCPLHHACVWILCGVMLCWLCKSTPCCCCCYVCVTGMFSDPDFAVRSQVVDKRGRLLGQGSRTRKADEAIKRWAAGRGTAQHLSQLTSACWCSS